MLHPIYPIYQPFISSRLGSVLAQISLFMILQCKDDLNELNGCSQQGELHEHTTFKNFRIPGSTAACRCQCCMFALLK